MRQIKREERKGMREEGCEREEEGEKDSMKGKRKWEMERITIAGREWNEKNGGGKKR